jgi:hypothetical protein
MGIVPDIIFDNAPQDGKADEKKRQSLREENLPGHLMNPQQNSAPQQDQGDKDKEKLLPPPAGPTGDETIDNDAQLKRALDLLKSWDVFKQLVQKKAA